MSPRVYNRRLGKEPMDAVYVGRPSKWGNPYIIGRDGDRAEVVNKYRLMLRDVRYGLAQEAKAELRGKDLVCWCAPEACHADVLLELANRTEDTQEE